MMMTGILPRQESFASLHILPMNSGAGIRDKANLPQTPGIAG